MGSWAGGDGGLGRGGDGPGGEVPESGRLVLALLNLPPARPSTAAQHPSTHTTPLCDLRNIENEKCGPHCEGPGWALACSWW